MINIDYLRHSDKYVTRDRRIADNGLFSIFNQVFRCLYHSRLEYVMQRYKEDPNFHGDIILIEPQEDDSYFFEMNPFAFWTRAKAAKLGFESVSKSIKGRYNKLHAILGSYGIEMTRETILDDEAKIRRAANDDESIMDVLENSKTPLHRRALRIVGR